MNARVSHARALPKVEREQVFWKSAKVGWLGPAHQPMTLITFVNGKTGHAFARFAPNGSTEEQLRALRAYIETMGCPKRIATAEGLGTMSQLPRALKELGVLWASQNQPHADGVSARLFRDIQERIVPSFQAAGISTIENANRYLDQVYLPRWNSRREPGNVEVNQPAPSKDDLDSILSVVTLRVLNSRNVLRYKNRIFGVPPGQVPQGPGGSVIRIEACLDGGVRFRLADQNVPIELIERDAAHQESPGEGKKAKKLRKIGGYNRSWMKGFLDRPAPQLWKSFGSR